MAPGRAVRVLAAPAAIHTEHLRHSKCAVHCHPASISITWHRTFLCLFSSSRHANRTVKKATVRVVRLVATANMGGILGDEELERVLEFIDGGEDR